MKQNYLNKYGEVVTKTFKELGTSWFKINNYRADTITKKEHEFLKKYGLKPTVFNVANLRELGHIHLTEHFVKVVLKNGGIDKRDN